MLDWIVSLIEGTGYLGIALLMLAENVFPPIPSELVMPLAGYAAARGELSLVPAVLAGSAGSLAGALFWYEVGRRIGAERLERFAARHGRWLAMTPRDVRRADEWFDRRGGVAVLVGRLVPAVRTLISVPAGLSGMPLPRFLAFSSLGTLAWTAALATAGWLLGDRHALVAGWLDPIAKVVVALMVLGYLYRVVTFRRREPS